MILLNEKKIFVTYLVDIFEHINITMHLLTLSKYLIYNV